jgi:hypothetical protein
LCDYKAIKLTTIFDMPSIQASTVVRSILSYENNIDRLVSVADEHHEDEYTHHTKIKQPIELRTPSVHARLTHYWVFHIAPMLYNHHE